MATNSLNKYVNSLNPKKTVLKTNSIPIGEIGYDNPRDNIDPHIKTLTIDTKDGTIQKIPVNNKDIVNKAYVDSQNLIVSGNILLNISGSFIVPKNFTLGFETAASIGLSGQTILLQDGSQATPAYSWKDSTNSGFFFSSTLSPKQLRLSMEGTNIMQADTAQIRFIVPGAFSDGTVSAPGLTFRSDLDTGIFRPASGQFSLVGNGREIARLHVGASTSGMLIGTDLIRTGAKLEISGGALVMNNFTTNISNNSGGVTYISGGELWFTSSTPVQTQITGGATGSFTTVDLKTVTVTKGIVTSIV